MSYTTDAGIRVYERGTDFWLRRPRSVSPLGPLKRVTFHHGGPVGGYRDSFAEAVATWQGWQAYHMDDHNWADIGYHFGVDAFGRLYEGRDHVNIGAHVAYQNTGNLGINFMQDGRFFELTDKQKEMVRLLFEYGIPRLDIRPLKYYTTHAGDDWGVFTHRELGPTDCPGDLIQRHIAWRRNQYI